MRTTVEPKLNPPIISPLSISCLGSISISVSFSKLKNPLFVLILSWKNRSCHSVRYFHRIKLKNIFKVAGQSNCASANKLVITKAKFELGILHRCSKCLPNFPNHSRTFRKLILIEPTLVAPTAV